MKKGELFRITYISGIDCSDTILFTFHHLILDGWSKIILINEIRNYLSNGNMLYDSNGVQPGEYARFIEKQKNAENSKVFGQITLQIVTLKYIGLLSILIKEIAKI